VHAPQTFLARVTTRSRALREWARARTPAAFLARRHRVQVHLLLVEQVAPADPVVPEALVVPAELVAHAPASVVALVEQALPVVHLVQLAQDLVLTVRVLAVAVAAPAAELLVLSVRAAARASRASRKQPREQNLNSAKPRRLVAYRFPRVTAPRSSAFVVALRWPTSLRRLARAPRTS
jgi:hypothetical protein